ncbi:MAG: preprotein translocase subunit YajC [Oscillibacter sp.]|nr:preprotein translocase subunit YajC [Oscillibacter sp.]
MEQGYIAMMIVLVGMMVFYYMRDNKQKKKTQAMRDSLKKGDVITTIGGIVGKIVAVTENTIVIETSEDRVRMELTKWSVSSTGVQNSDMPETRKEKKKEEKEALPESSGDEEK